MSWTEYINTASIPWRYVTFVLLNGNCIANMKLSNGIIFPLAAAAAATVTATYQERASSSASNITITSNKVERSFLLWVSPKYNSKSPATVIVSYHGGTKNAHDQLELDGFTKANANAASIVVYPQGINVSLSWTRRPLQTRPLNLYEEHLARCSWRHRQ